MEENNVIGNATATILAPMVDNLPYLVLWAAVAIVLLVSDLRFGICAARKRGEKIRPSRAIRRTVNKLVDYFCWVSIAYVVGGGFGLIFGFPIIPAVIMLLVCAVELSSIADNYCEYKGLKKRLNIFKLTGKLIGKAVNVSEDEIKECIEDK